MNLCSSCTAQQQALGQRVQYSSSAYITDTDQGCLVRARLRPVLPNSASSGGTDDVSRSAGTITKADLEASRLVFVMLRDAKPRRKVAIPIMDTMSWTAFEQQVRVSLVACKPWAALERLTENTLWWAGCI